MIKSDAHDTGQWLRSTAFDSRSRRWSSRSQATKRSAATRSDPRLRGLRRPKAPFCPGPVPCVKGGYCHSPRGACSVNSTHSTYARARVIAEFPLKAAPVASNCPPTACKAEDWRGLRARCSSGGAAEETGIWKDSEDSTRSSEKRRERSRRRASASPIRRSAVRSKAYPRRGVRLTSGHKVGSTLPCGWRLVF